CRINGWAVSEQLVGGFIGTGTGGIAAGQFCRVVTDRRAGRGRRRIPDYCDGGYCAASGADSGARGGAAGLEWFACLAVTPLYAMDSGWLVCAGRRTGIHCGDGAAGKNGTGHYSAADCAVYSVAELGQGAGNRAGRASVRAIQWWLADNLADHAGGGSRAVGVGLARAW